MSSKTPRTRGDKKAPQLSLKEKRAAKREKQEDGAFLKPRKGSSR
ncbi:hypothetical protein [Microbacterium sp. SMR1]|nr:hypothetical protein [Microbacterium sp. SMR1]